MVLGAWKHFLISSLKILYGITMIFSPFKPIFPLETKKVALYAPEQNVPSDFTFKTLFRHYAKQALTHFV